jgi:hypothetical protein
VLDYYIVDLIFTALFIFGGLVLVIEYAQNLSGSPDAWSDLYYALGSISLILAGVFIICMFIAWILKLGAPLQREDESAHWLHMMSIFAAGLEVVWGVLALIMAFGPTFATSVPNQLQTAAYFIILVCTIYHAYLIVRYAAGFAKAKASTSTLTSAAQNNAEIFSALRNIAIQKQTPAPLFGPGSGALAFGGIDLGGLLPSSTSSPPQGISTIPHPVPVQQPGCYPMPMMMPMQMPCVPAMSARCPPSDAIYST